jgi:hypothetical protein
MYIEYEASGSLATLQELLSDLAAQPDVGSLMLFACAANAYTSADLDPILCGVGKPLFGGIFPGVIHGSRYFVRGNLVVALPATAYVRPIEHLSDPQRDLERTVAALADTSRSGTLLVFVDGQATRIDDLIDLLFDHLGLTLNQIGVGAGTLSLHRHPCVLCNDGLLTDAALLVHLDLPSRTAMGHGWNIVSDSLKITEARGNVILRLNDRPAFDVYREAIAAHCGSGPTQVDYYVHAKAYPFGIFKLGGEVVVRDPLAVGDDGSLICVGEVSVGTFVHVLHGEPAALIQAAGAAVRRAEAGGPGMLRLLFDCVSRAHFLAGRFAEELAAVGGDEPMVGVLALGEICNGGGDYPEFHNKTAVIALLGMS